MYLADEVMLEFPLLVSEQAPDSQHRPVNATNPASTRRGYQMDNEALAETAARDKLRLHADKWRSQGGAALRPLKREMYKVVRSEVAEVGPLTETAFYDRVWPQFAAPEWREPGRRPKQR
jgi:hypothetical protein